MGSFKKCRYSKTRKFKKRKGLYKAIGLDEHPEQLLCAVCPGWAWVQTDSADTETGEEASKS